jgi:2-keto-4-pentenoate hydratase/2-oxohepta-3-ene-1,7-dioic acid hydratase in catechol pathway
MLADQRGHLVAALADRQLRRSLLAPIAPPNIFCIGLNYRAHAAETGAPIPDKPVCS